VIRILVTNDDGVHSPGLRALVERLGAIGEVTVVAPDREVSGISHALTVSEPLRYEKLEESVFAVAGTPADCVNLAIGNLLKVAPDLVVSGINRGANVADDVTYSGTVAGAMEGAMLGITSFAVSLASKQSEDFATAAEFALQLAQIVSEKKLPHRTFLNVNVPIGKVEGVRITSQGSRPNPDQTDMGARLYSWITQGWSGAERNGISDIAAVRENLISVTPLHVDFTNYHALDELASWGLNWNGGRPRRR
jgi:5'-nucleotidase